VTEISKELGLDKSAASRRVYVAVSKGYLANREDRKGRPARIALGDPMPGETEILPHPDQLADRCSVAGGDWYPSPSLPTPPLRCQRVRRSWYGCNFSNDRACCWLALETSAVRGACSSPDTRFFMGPISIRSSGTCSA
jgi:hypothetical protein